MKYIRSFNEGKSEKENYTLDKLKKQNGIILNELITIKPFVNSDDKRKVKLKPFHLILGENSCSIFDFYNSDEIAGLKKEDCLEFLDNNESEEEDSFIAGLTNIYEGNIFIFFNNERLKKLSKERLVPHECLHLARYLITLLDNKDIDIKEPNWWKKTKFTKLDDDNEELFAEVLERCTEVVFNELKSY